MASGVVQSSALPGMRVPSRAVRAGGKGLRVGEGRYVCVGGSEEGADSGRGVRRLPQGHRRAECGVRSRWGTAQHEGGEDPSHVPPRG